MTPEEKQLLHRDLLKIMSGHSTTNLIDNVYKQLDKEKELSFLSNALTTATANNDKPTAGENIINQLIDEIKPIKDTDFSEYEKERIMKGYTKEHWKRDKKVIEKLK